jgi:hypothetical protein
VYEGYFENLNTQKSLVRRKECSFLDDPVVNSLSFISVGIPLFFPSDNHRGVPLLSGVESFQCRVPNSTQQCPFSEVSKFFSRKKLSVFLKKALW